MLRGQRRPGPGKVACSELNGEAGHNPSVGALPAGTRSA